MSRLRQIRRRPPARVNMHEVQLLKYNNHCCMQTSCAGPIEATAPIPPCQQQDNNHDNYNEGKASLTKTSTFVPPCANWSYIYCQN